MSRRAFRARSIGRIFLVLALLVIVGAQTVAAAIPEYQVKAAFLINFLRFVEWPSSQSDDSIDLCFVGPEEMQTAVLQMLQSRSYAERQVVIRALEQPDDAVTCSLIFVSRFSPGGEAAVLSRVSGRPVLTVGEKEGFIREGGIVNFVIRDGKVRFQVHRTRALASGLEISSKLLRLAEIVDGDAVGQQ